VAELFEAAVEHEPAARADFLARGARATALSPSNSSGCSPSTTPLATFLNSAAGLGSLSVSDDEELLKTQPAALSAPAALIGQKKSAPTP